MAVLADLLNAPRREAVKAASAVKARQSKLKEPQNVAAARPRAADAPEQDPDSLAARLPEDVVNLALGFVDGPTLTRLRAASRAYERRAELALKSLAPFAAREGGTLRLTLDERRRHRALVARRDDALPAAAPRARLARDVDLDLHLDREGPRAFPGLRRLDDWLVVVEVAGRRYGRECAFHARDVPSLTTPGHGWLEFDVAHDLTAEHRGGVELSARRGPRWPIRAARRPRRYGARRDEKHATIGSLVAAGDVPTAAAIFFDSVEALRVDLTLISLEHDRVVDVVRWNPDARVDAVHEIEGRVVIVDGNAVSRAPVDDEGRYLYVGAQLEVDLRRGEAAVSFQVNLCGADGDEFFGAHALHGRRSVGDALARGLRGVAEPRAAKRVVSLTSVSATGGERPG